MTLARFRFAGEDLAMLKVTLGTVPAVCVCPAGEPAFYVSDVDVPKLSNAEMPYGWRLAPMAGKAFDEIQDWPGWRLPTADTVPDPLARRAWSVVDAIRVASKMDGPPPRSIPPLVPILGLPVHFSDGVWKLNDPGGTYGCLVVARFGPFEPVGAASLVPVPEGVSVPDLARDAFDELERCFPGLRHCIVLQPSIGPAFAEMRWMQEQNRDYVRVHLV